MLLLFPWTTRWSDLEFQYAVLPHSYLLNAQQLCAIMCSKQEEETFKLPQGIFLGAGFKLKLAETTVI